MSDTSSNVPDIQVVQDILEVDDEAGLYIQDGDGSNIFGDYVVINRYEKDGHRYMMSMTDPEGFEGDTVSFCQLGNPTLLWLADWTGSRAGLQPAVPNPIVNDPGWVLLDEHIEPEMVVVGPDGVTPIYRISGTYVYGHRRPSSVTLDNINYGRPPWLEDVIDRIIPVSLYQGSIIDVETGAGPTLVGGSLSPSPGTPGSP